MDQFDPLGRGINNIYINSFTYEFFCLYFLDPPYNITVFTGCHLNLGQLLNCQEISSSYSRARFGVCAKHGTRAPRGMTYYTYRNYRCLDDCPISKLPLLECFGVCFHSPHSSESRVILCVVYHKGECCSSMNSSIEGEFHQFLHCHCASP